MSGLIISDGVFLRCRTKYKNMATKKDQTSTESLAKLSAPALRALANHGITTLKRLSEYSEKDIMQFHGMGKGSLPKLPEALAANGLAFKPH